MLMGKGAAMGQRATNFDQLKSELNTAALDENLLPGGALAKACRYALNLRTQLRRSLENGVTEIDNNRCEQSIRPITLGRKNWLHIEAPAPPRRSPPSSASWRAASAWA
jgi:hypothetical protein